MGPNQEKYPQPDVELDLPERRIHHVWNVINILWEKAGQIVALVLDSTLYKGRSIKGGDEFVEEGRHVTTVSEAHTDN